MLKILNDTCSKYYKEMEYKYEKQLIIMTHDQCHIADSLSSSDPLLPPRQMVAPFYWTVASYVRVHCKLPT